MKKKAVVVGLLLSMVMSITAHASEITENCVVTGVDKANDRLLLQSEDGNIFLWQGVEDWLLLDVASITFDDRETADRTDDKIISMTYTGYLL